MVARRGEDFGAVLDRGDCVSDAAQDAGDDATRRGIGFEKKEADWPARGLRRLGSGNGQSSARSGWGISRCREDTTTAPSERLDPFAPSGRPATEAVVDSPSCPFGSARSRSPPRRRQAAGHTHRKESCARMRRYELMLVLRPDVPDERIQAVIDRTTRGDRHGRRARSSRSARGAAAGSPTPSATTARGRTHIVLFDAPAEAVSELERGLNITEEVLRHLVTRDRAAGQGLPPGRRGRRCRRLDIDAGPPADDEEDEGDTEFIDESESEAAPAAIDVDEGTDDVTQQVHDHRQPGPRPGDALHAQRPGRDPVHGRRQPQLQATRTASGRRRPSGSASWPGASRRSAPPRTCARAARSTSRAASRPASGRTGRPEALHDRARRRPCRRTSRSGRAPRTSDPGFTPRPARQTADAAAPAVAGGAASSGPGPSGGSGALARRRPARPFRLRRPSFLTT